MANVCFRLLSRCLSCGSGPVVLFLVQAALFSVMGLGIMRLMMFGTVSLCVLASLATNADALHAVYNCVWQRYVSAVPQSNWMG